MPASSWDLSKLVDALGWRHGQQPHVEQTIQPVDVVAIHKRLGAPLHSPQAICGGIEQASGGRGGAFEIESNAPGGMDVWFNGQCSAASTLTLRILAQPKILLTASIACPMTNNTEEGAGDVVARAFKGEEIFAGLTSWSATVGPQTTKHWGPVYVPKGTVLHLNTLLTDGFSTFGAWIIEYPAAQRAR